MANKAKLRLTSVKLVDHLFEGFYHQLDINLIFKN